ncbi:MAG: XdhC family protein [Acidobacteriota bacterium]
MKKYYSQLLQTLNSSITGLSAMVIKSDEESYLGHKVCTDAVGRLLFHSGPAELTDTLLNVLNQHNHNMHTILQVPGAGTVFIEPLQAAPNVLILGGGHVAQALSKILSVIRYQVTVVDDRSSFADTLHFPGADQVVCGAFIEVIEKHNFNKNDFAVICTRGHSHDMECLRALIGKPLGYIGMIGSAQKTRTIFAALENEGITWERLADVHSPIGLDIGARTPEEIAVSIAAEIISVNNQLRGEPLDVKWLERVAAVEQAAAIVTVTMIMGCAPRKAGARMLVMADGSTYGTIGGGTGEEMARVNALEVIDTGKPQYFCMDMNNEIAANDGMICGGQMQMFIEPL